MRIALIAPPWLPVPPPLYGGTETVVDRLARGFAAEGHDVCLYATGDSTCPVPRAWSYEAAKTSQMGDSVIAISHDQAATAGDLPIAAVIHHGVDPASFPVGAGDGGYFAFLGRMDATKGVREAVVAAREAGVPLLIAAKNREPLEKEYFETHVRPLLGGDIEYLGEIGAEEKLEFLGGARALINPIQWHEPFGLVMIEALACGTPVLAFPNGAAPEIVDHGSTGYLCRDLLELVEAIGCADDLDRSACRRAVEERFSTQRMVRDHLDLYRTVTGRRARDVERAIAIAKRHEREASERRHLRTIAQIG